MKPIHCAGAAVVALAVLLGACSSGADATGGAATQSQWLAVASGKVDVEGGMVLIAAHADGVVESIEVEPGDTVKAGAVLATLDPRSAKIRVATARAGVQQARAQRDELQVALKQAAQRAPRIEAAAKAGAATGEAAARARDAVATLKAKNAAAEAALEVAKQDLAAAQLRLDATTLRAPVAGSIVMRQVAIGQSVSASSGQPLFELLPDRPRVVHAQLDASRAGAVHAGMRAEVVRESGTGPVYAATVTWVGQVLQPASLTRDPLQRALANDVDCTLAFAPLPKGQPPLRIGQRVLVRFPQSH